MGGQSSCKFATIIESSAIQVSEKNMLKAINLSKNYHGQIALDALDLNIEAGDVYCLLGANGAGKTTTINLFLNFIQPDGGKALINGFDVAEKPLETKKYLAYIPEQVNLYKNLSGLGDFRPNPRKVSIRDLKFW